MTTYLLGLLGMLQALFLPGLCLAVFFKHWNWTQRLLFAPPLSLLLNHYLVWLLVSLGSYSQGVMLGIASLEILWLAYRWWWLPRPKIEYPRVDRWAELLCFALAVMALTKYAQAWGRNFGDVFQMWDAIVSWNAWARAWFEGVRPESGLYPHGLPISLSLPYAFMGHADLETFSKANMGILYLCGLGALLELGFRRKDLRTLAWLTVYLYPIIQSKFLHSHWNSGYADVPLAVMLLYGFCFSTLPGREGPWLMGLSAGASALVKQPGLLFAAVVPFLRKLSLRSVLAIGMGAGVALLPWYLFIVSRIAGGRSGHNTSFLANLVPGGLAERWSFTLQLLTGYAGGWAPVASAFLLSTAGAIVSVDARRWWLLLGLPYFLIWGTFFAYDSRNISMALFPLALAISAIGASALLKVESVLPRRLRIRSRLLDLNSASNLGKLALLATFLLFAFSLKKPIGHWKKYGSMESWESEQRLYLGDAPDANRVAWELSACGPIGHKLLSNFWWPQVVPHLKPYLEAVGITCEDLQQAISKGDPVYIYLHKPTCDLSATSAVTIFSQGDVAILAANPNLPLTCERD